MNLAGCSSRLVNTPLLVCCVQIGSGLVVQHQMVWQPGPVGDALVTNEASHHGF